MEKNHRVLNHGRTLTVLALLLGTSATVASLDAENEVDDVAAASIQGQSHGDHLGQQVLGIPDINGDDIADFAIAAPGYDEQRGGVAVFFGSDGALPESFTWQDADLHLIPESYSEAAGSAMVTGDFNNDGLSDLAIGAPYANSSNGRVYIVFGKEDWAVGSSPLAVQLKTGIYFDGALSGQFGSALAALQLNGLTGDDLVIGEPNANTGAGRVYLQFGANANQAGWTSTSATNLDAYYLGGAGYNLGFSLANAGNVDSDGREDLLIGAPGGSLNSAGAGSTFLILGKDSGNFTINMFIESPGKYDALFYGSSMGDFSGGMLAGVGDITDNGLGDFVIGATNAKYNGLTTGRFSVIEGRPASGWNGSTYDIVNIAAGSFVADGSAELFRTSFSRLGDINEDGIDDFMVGAPNGLGTLNGDDAAESYGEVFVIYGADGGYPANTVVSDSTYVSGSILGTEDGSNFGGSVALVNDYDGDGEVEILIGAHEYEAAGDVVGKAYLINPFEILDFDDDGYSLLDGDCDDENPDFYPYAPEVAYNGLDEDCDGEDLTDVDGDGFDASEVGGPDCNDSAIGVNPGASEVPYNDVDENCDGVIVYDVDGDGYDGGSGPDCDDNAEGTYPGAPEIPYDDIDQDCSGADLKDVDEDGVNGGPAGNDCNDNDDTIKPGAVEVPYDGIDQDCTGADLTDVDGDGIDATDVGGPDCDDTNETIYPGAVEACNGEDDDCDDLTDEGFDGDGDGHVIASEICPLGDDCDDSDATVYGGAPELCDSKDNDCDTTADEGFDADGDGYFDAEACTGFGDDCDDSNGDIHPGVEDICDGVDNDCNGKADDPFDGDGDGYIDAERCGLGDDCDDSSDAVNPGAVEVAYDGIDQDCSGADLTDVDNDGFDSSEVSGGDDCDDGNPDINPDADEIPYDGIDQDCDDTDLEDVDGDGFISVEVPGGTDCDDNDDTVNPDGTEIPYDGIDQDCVDGDLSDVDGDGHDGGEDGFDCDDSNENVYPNADEICLNGTDDNCNGEIDENCSGVDVDGDGFTFDVDCDDENPEAYPNATEVCDSEIDLNCDGVIGENCYDLGGGWGCNSAPSSKDNGAQGALILATLLGGMALRRRRKVLAAATLVSSAVAMPVAEAQEVVPTDINHLNRPVDALGLTGTESATSLQQRQFSVGLFYSYLHQPVQLVNSGTGDYLALIDNQNIVDVNAAFGITDWLQVGVGMPLVMSQSSEAGLTYGGYGSGFAPGSARAQLKIAPLTTNGGFSVGVVPTFHLPVDEGGQMIFDGLLALEQDLGRIRFIVNGGYRALLESDSPAGQVRGASLGTGSILAQGGLAFRAIPQTLDIIADAWAEIGLNNDDLVRYNPAEASVAAVFRPSPSFYINAGVGSALNGGYGAARIRGFAGLGYSSASGMADADTDGDGIPDVWDKCRKDPEDLDQWQDSDGCPDTDNDGDGVSDAKDTCPDAAEDSDGWEDEDGCPDIDNDSDQVSDDIDLCPEEPEDADGWQDGDGCPDLDNDGDGVLDPVDQCPDEAEDMDGILDNDGCPDIDNDKDGIVDEEDACLEKPEDIDGFEDEDGCPDYDNDGDGIPDLDEFCPDSKEDLNGFRDDDGCPESGPQVVMVRGEIRILEELRFKGGKGALNSKGRRHLDAAVRLLEKAPADKYIIIEAHTDNAGDREPNRAKTQAQAEVVMNYLVSKGIPAARIVPRGYGEDRPMGTNRTERGRERNRRVILVLVDEIPAD